MTTPRLVSLGRLTLDDVILPDGTRRPECVGGNSLYGTLAARLWEPSAQLVARVGHDLPERVWDQIRQAGLSPTGLRPRPARTLRNEFYYNPAGGRRSVSLSAQHESLALSPTPDDIPAEYLGAEIFLVKAMDLHAQSELVAWLKANARGRVALDLKETYLEGNEACLTRMISQTDIFMPSEAEAIHLAQGGDWLTIARHFSTLGPRIVAIKLGAQGSFVYDGRHDAGITILPYPARVVDPTGAGDAYCGGFLAMYLNRPDDLVGCARAGAVSASFAISGFGTEALLAARPEAARRRLIAWYPGLYDSLRTPGQATP